MYLLKEEIPALFPTKAGRMDHTSFEMAVPSPCTQRYTKHFQTKRGESMGVIV